jgi:hypothetical protein
MQRSIMPMSDHTLLPPGFESLEPFLGYWDRPTTDERWRQRTASTMEEIRRFYDAMLALVNASISVEMLGQPRVPYSPYPQPVRLIRGPVYWG